MLISEVARIPRAGRVPGYGSANVRWKSESRIVGNERFEVIFPDVGSSRVDLQACKLEYSIVSPK